LRVQRKEPKKARPNFAALRVPDFSDAARAAAQLALRAQTVLADFPRTASEKSAAQKGIGKPSTRLPALKRLAGSQCDGFTPPFSRSRDFETRLGAVGERCLSEASSFAAQPCSEITGFRRMWGVLSLPTFFAQAKKVGRCRAPPANAALRAQAVLADLPRTAPKLRGFDGCGVCFSSGIT
jgi:hypothetical protein